MSDICAECGAPLADGATCRDNFYALLGLEWEVPQGAGTQAHFFAVSSYILQHPDSMNYTAESLEWLREAVRSALAQEITVAGLRAQAAELGGAAGNVTRRDGDVVPRWEVVTWRMTVADILRAGTPGYGDRVRHWADTVLKDLDEAGCSHE